MTETALAIRLIIAQAVLFAVENAAIHAVGPDLGVMQLALLRSAGGVALAVGLAWHSGAALVHTKHLGLQLLRGGVSLLYLWVLIYSFAELPFADATAISYTQTAYIALFSVLILGETVPPTRWAAAGMGIFGAVLIAKPSFSGWHGAYLVAVLGTSLNGLSFVLNRYLQRDDSETTTLFYSNIVPLVGNLPALAMAMVPVSNELVWLPCILLLGPLGMLAGIVAVRHANASLLGPYTLLRLIIAIVGGAVFFRELPDFCSSAGALVILASCLLSSARFSGRSARLAAVGQ